MEYAFLDANDIVQSVIYFDTSPEDITPFLEAQKAILGIEYLRALEVDFSFKRCTVGFKLNDTDFKPVQPYPSYLWDEARYMWRAPVPHPHLLSGITDTYYEWDEENLQWTPTQP
jgi:hypothetical protein